MNKGLGYYTAYLRLIMVVVATAGTIRRVSAQIPPVQPNPLAPTLAMSLPMGAQRGTNLDLTLTGTNLAEPTAIWTSFAAKTIIPADKNNGKDNGQLRVHFEIPKDAPIGFHTLRVATTRGFSNFRIFCVDDLIQVQSTNTNRSPLTAQLIPFPCVVVGRIDPEVTDYYKIAVKAGQRLSFDVLGRRLGSVIDPQVSVLELNTHRELAYSNDAPGLQTDARITYTFKNTGQYLVALRDVTYRGGADFVYRMRVGDFPCATAPIPMAGKRGTKVMVHFAGPVVDGIAPVEVAVPTDPTVNLVWVSPRGTNGLFGWPVALAASDFEEAVETEPNNDKSKANRISVPGGITGRFLRKGDVDYYVFAGKKGTRYLIRAYTHEFNSPAEVFLTLKDAKGNQIAAVNPAAEPRLDFTAPIDGDYYLEAEHLNYWGGPEETYWLTIKPFEPGFDVTLGIERYDLPQGGITAVPIQTVERRDYNGPIELEVVSTPNITGKGVIPPGPPAPNQPAGFLYLRAAPASPVGPLSLVIQGKAKINGKNFTTFASVKTVISNELAGLAYPPRDLINRVAVAVTPKAPFELSAKLAPPEAIRGSPVNLTILATRVAGFNEEIVLAPVGLPVTITAALKNIPKSKNDIQVQITPAANALLGDFTVSFSGKAKFQNRDYTITASPLTFAVMLPFELRIDPVSVKLAQGAKAKIKAIVVRKGGYNGAIVLEAKNLPSNVVATKPTVAAGSAVAEIEISAGANAALGTKADLIILGMASQSANQQNGSPPFSLTIVKK